MVKKTEKILVLVTTQENSLRLIEHGFALAQECGGELHILHVQKGDSIFEGNDTLRLLQNLADYGGRRGGNIHIYCEKDIAECIGRFAEEEEMTYVIMGQPSQEGAKKNKNVNEYDRILEKLPAKIKIFSIPKEEEPKKETAVA